MTENLSLETTRKRSLEIMHKGMIAYKLAKLGLDVSEHLGDGFDFIVPINNSGITKNIKIELKAVDIDSYSGTTNGFSQYISANEIVASTHLIVSIFDNIKPMGHYIMTIKQVFQAIKEKNTSKYVSYKNFQEYKNDCITAVKKKTAKRKGSTLIVPRMHIDIGCSFKKLAKDKWELEPFNNQWDNLRI